MVKVENFTREPDGSRKTCLFRVPPEFRTEKGAVAWTFVLQESHYNPEVET